MDTSSIHLPNTCGAIKGEPSTHGHNPTGVEDVRAKIVTLVPVKWGLRVSRNSGATGKRPDRTTEMRELTDEEMVRAYDEL